MTNAAAHQADAIRHRARRGLTIYFGTVLILWAAIEGYIISNPRNGLIAMLMLVPTLASVVARLFLREDFADVSFR